jgi:hypothetical protein
VAPAINRAKDAEPCALRILVMSYSPFQMSGMLTQLKGGAVVNNATRIGVLAKMNVKSIVKVDRPDIF